MTTIDPNPTRDVTADAARIRAGHTPTRNPADRAQPAPDPWEQDAELRRVRALLESERAERARLSEEVHRLLDDRQPSACGRRDVALLHAFGDHLEQHPDLSSVNVTAYGGVQVATMHNGGADLLAWARTTYDPDMTVQAIKGTAYCTVHGRLENGHEVSVWTTVPGFLEALGGRFTTASPVHLSGLAAFVECAR